MFDKTNLQPIHAASAKGKGSSKTVSKRTMLEKYSGDVNGKGKKKAEGDEDDEEEMDSNQLNMVYQKAIKNDAFLPEMDPPPAFALSLRGCMHLLSLSSAYFANTFDPFQIKSKL